ncbi:MAG: type IV pili twitching motility protein PilT [Phascolarctobacterium sp.]|nr:MAG: type IV pili twitching motility protein PilT [Phascolarctobacterium sp.]
MLKEIIKTAVGQNASDIHLTSGCAPVLRIGGVLQKTSLPSVTENTISQFAKEYGNVAVPLQKEELDFACDYEKLCRLRVNIYRQSGRLSAAIRLIKSNIPSLKMLNAPQAIERFTDLRSGLLLITGPTGSGKSTTLAAVIDAINQKRAVHIITLEDPVEYRFAEVQSVIRHREVGSDTKSFAAGLRAALREDPDVIMVGELRDAETISIAVTAAETGHLVLATLHTRGTVSALARMVEAFPAEKQQQIRLQLADALQGIAAQQLVPAASGGRTAAFEVLTAAPAVRSLIRENKAYQLSSYLQGGRQQGMQCMDWSLADLVRRGIITRQTAAEYAFDLDLLNKYLMAK